MASQSSHLAALRRYTPDAHVAISVLSNVHGGGVAAPIIGALHGALPGEGAAYLVALGCDIAFGLVDSLRSLALSNAPALLVCVVARARARARVCSHDAPAQALAGSLPRLIAEIAAAHDTAHPQQAAGLQELSALFRTFGVARLPVVDADADADAEAEVDAEGGLEGACAIAREFVSAMVTALPAPENRCQETLDFLLAIVRGAPPADGTPRPTDAPSRLRAGVYSELPGIFGVEALGHDGGRATLLAAPPAFFELCVAFERAAARGASRGIDFPRLAEFALEALRVSRGDVHALGAEAAKLLAEVPLPALLAAWLAAMEAPGAGPPGGAGAAADGVPGHEQLLTDLRTLTLGPCDFGVSASDATALALDDTCGYDIEVGLSRALPPDAVLTAGTLWEVQCALLAPMLPPPGAPPPFVAPGDAAGWEALPPLLTALRRLRKSDLRATASRARTAAVHAVHGGASVANVPNFDALLAGSVTLSFGLMDMIAPQCFAWNLPRFPPYSLLFGGLARDIAFVMQVRVAVPVPPAARTSRRRPPPRSASSSSPRAPARASRATAPPRRATACGRRCRPVRSCGFGRSRRPRSPPRPRSRTCS